MRKLYGSTSWRRVLALVLVFVMMFSIMGTSGYSVFAEGLEETGEAVVEPAAEEPAQEEEFTPQGESPGEEEAEAVVETEEGEVEVEAVEEAEEEAEEPAEEAVEEAADDEESEELAEAVEEEAEEGEELEAAPAEEAEEDAEEPAEEPAEEEREEEETLIAEAAQIIEGDDGEVAPEEENKEEVVEESAEEELAEGEELPEEELLEEAVAMPAIEADEDFKDARVYVYAPEGAFFEGTTVEIKAVKLGRTQIAAVSGVVEETVADYVAYDITFYDAEGAEAQPSLPVTVNIEPKKMTAPENLQVVHMEDEKSAAVVESEVTEEGLAFNAEHFSIYVVVESSTNARAKVVFMNGTTEVASMYVKEGDDMNQVIYDPGTGSLGTGVLFKGWTTNENYAPSPNGLTIEGVRQELAGYDWSSVIDADSEGGTIITYHAMLVKQYTITYIGEDNASLGQEYVDYRADATGEGLIQEYTVNMAYTPADENHDFQGWLVSDGTVLSAVYEDEAVTAAPYLNNTVITISGDIVFAVNAPEGRWLIFDEVKKGATYCAPQFVLTGSVTKRPRPDNEMVCTGYTFGGWYTDEACTDGNEFDFGSELATKTVLYAKWDKKPTANYTVLIWKQNANCNGYDFVASKILSGSTDNTVAQENAIVQVPNGDTPYVTVGGTAYNYKGFALVTEGEYAYDANVAIKPEGDTVVNIYYDRVEYTLKFYYARSFTTNNTTYYQASTGTQAWNPNWADPATVAVVCNASNIATEPGGNASVRIGNRTYNVSTTLHYYYITAKYGTDISSSWPAYSDFPNWTTGGGPGGSTRELISWGLMQNAEAYVNTGQSTVKGVIGIMDEQVLGDLSDAEGNCLYASYGTGANDWAYNIYWEMADGETTADYPLGTKAYTYNGVTKTYGLHEVVSSKSRGGASTWDYQQKPPAYSGFISPVYDDDAESIDHAVLLTTAPTGYDFAIDYFYDRMSYEINFMDGVYVTGNNMPGDTEQVRTTVQLHESDPIPFGTKLSSYADYRPTLPSGQAGYVFEGWFMDEGCTSKYDFEKATMPKGGITVYAKWRQIRYRVFLHPCAGTDPTLDWGSANQAMNFSIPYGGKVSAPDGTRSNQIFVGWYMDENYTQVFNADAYVLNDTTVPDNPAYDKETEMTDYMNKYGVAESGPNGEAPFNSDKDRFWVTRKLDLYAKWRAAIDGADGIGVQYSLKDPDVANMGTGTAEDTNLYVDNAKAAAVPAVNAPNGYRFDCWVMQKWDDTANNGEGGYVDVTGSRIYPGAEYTVLASNAHVYDIVYKEDGKTIKSATYTIQLRAKYIPIDEATPTFIPWFKNDGTAAFHYDKLAEGVTDYKDSQLLINEAVNIQPAQTLEDCTFKGWARVSMGDTTEAADTFLTTEANWTQSLTVNSEAMLLYYNAADGLFYKDAAFSTQATRVAADEATPYQAMFAVWDEAEVTINYAVATSDVDLGLVSNDKDIVKIRTGQPTGSTASVKDGVAGYIFAGWTCDNGTEYVSTNAQFTPEKSADGKYESHTYYAHFTKAMCTITFVDDDGTTVLQAATQYAYGTPAAQITKPTDPTKAPTTEKTYTFAGWNPAVHDVDGDQTYVATYTEAARQYTIKFVDDDGTTVLQPATQYAYGTPAAQIVKPADPTKEATAEKTFTFNGWNPAVADVTGDQTYVATYTEAARQYTITFVDEDETTVLQAATQYAYGTPAAQITKPADPTKEATAEKTFTFNGWNPAVADVTGDQIYVATYTETARQYTIKFVNYDDTELQSESLAYGTMPEYKAATPTKPSDGETNYSFNGWDKEIVAVVGDATYKAQFVEALNKYTVTFVDEDGTTVLKEATEYEYGTKAANIVQPETPTKASTAQYNYTFAGWTPELSDVTANATYKATYKEDPITYTVNYHSNYNGVEEADQRFVSDADQMVTIKIKSPDDLKGADNVPFSVGLKWTGADGRTWVFTGWNTKADGTGTAYAAGADYNGEGAVPPQQDDTNEQQPATNDGTANVIVTSAKSIRAMAATSTKAGSIDLYAQWTEETNSGGNPSRPPRDPEPDPTEEPDEEIPEDDTPLAPAEIEDEDTEIDDGDTPYAGYEEEPDEEVAEEPTPFSPYTGDDRHTAAWGFVSLLSLAGIVVMARRRREE